MLMWMIRISTRCNTTQNFCASYKVEHFSKIIEKAVAKVSPLKKAKSPCKMIPNMMKINMKRRCGEERR